MNSTLQEELRQTRPFASREQEAMLSIERTSAVLRHAIGQTLEPYGVTPTQYNVLRILRGAGPDGLCRHEIGDRLVTQVPDVTRLLDRMEDAGLVTRERSTVDRRLVHTRITPGGLALLDRLEEPLAALHQARMGHLAPEQLRTLIDLLALVRQGR